MEEVLVLMVRAKRKIKDVIKVKTKAVVRGLGLVRMTKTSTPTIADL
jgi:hypothetical protein